MSSDSIEIVTFFVISDSAGETATELAQVIMVQYPTVELNLFRGTLVTDEKTSMQALQDALKEETLALHTLTNQELIEVTRSSYEEHQLLGPDVMIPPISKVEHLIDIELIRRPNALHLLNENYFKRIETMEFAVKHDDGRDPRRLLEAGVVLLGVSRTSRTSLSLFSVNKNLKIANLPLIPQAYAPKQLWEIGPKKIVELTNNPDILNNTQRERMRSYGLSPDTTHSDVEEIRTELDFTNDPYGKLGCVVINVVSLSIEEAASLTSNAPDLEDHSYCGIETTEETD